jgi:Spy/CpxP family protein refolding chaperone
MLSRSLVVSGAVWLLIAALVCAQEKPAAEKPVPGPLGFGGLGGMVPGDLMLASQEVQKELGLSDEQKAQVKDLGREVRDQLRSALGNFNFGELRDLSREEREKRLGEARKKAEAAGKVVEEKLAKILDAKQLERLGQIRLQREGPAALARPKIAEQLGLSDEQKAKIKKILGERQPLVAPAGNQKPSPDQIRDFLAKMQERRSKTQSDLLAVLTDEQKAKWSELKGKEFKFPPFRLPAAKPAEPPKPPAGKSGE